MLGSIQIRGDLPLRAEAQQHGLSLLQSRTHQLDGDFLLIKLVGTHREVDLAHAAFPSNPIQLTGPDALSEIPEGNGLRGLLDRPLQKAEGLARRLDQRLNFLAQGGIVAACLIEKRGRLSGSRSESFVKQLLDPVPTTGSGGRTHGCISVRTDA